MVASLTKPKFATVALAVSVVLLFCVKEAQAIAITANGTGGAIPDGGAFDGTQPGIITSDIVLGNPGSVGDVTVTIFNLAHTYNGDLSFALTHTDTGTSVDLFHRPDLLFSTAPGPCCGDSTDLNGDFIFNDSGSTSLDTAVAGIGGGALTGGSFFAATFDGSQNLLSAFNGESVAGTWRLTATDWVNGFDVGSFDSWRLRIEVEPAAVPEPSLLLLLGSGVMGLAGWQLRQRLTKVS